MPARVSCPAHRVEVPLDMGAFRDAVVHDRCPLGGCPLAPFERHQSYAASGPESMTTGRCEPTDGGCGAEWALWGDDEVAWFGREVALIDDWDDDDEVADL